jgi:uncharacterized protein (DUF1501 family)
MDGISALMPVDEPDLLHLRPGLITETSQPLLDSHFLLHPRLAGFQALYDARQLVIFPSVASPYRGRSHRDAIQVLDSGSVDISSHLSGWIGRAAGLFRSRERPSLIATGGRIPLCLLGPCSHLQIGSPESGRLDDRAHFFANARPYTPFMSDDLISFARQSGFQVQPGEPVSAAADRYFVAAFEKSSNRLGQLLAKGGGPRIAILEYDGWDTHNDQGTTAGRVATLLAGLDKGVTLLREYCGANWRQTTVVVMSEFGRTVKMNSSGGTDHGVASVAFLTGGAVQGGRVVGDWPGLSQHRLIDGHSLRPTLDVRSILKGILMGQFGLSPRELDSTVFTDSPTIKPLDDLLVV